MAGHARDVITFKYYRPLGGIRDKAEEILKEEKAKNPNKIHYIISAARSYPGRFLLSYLPRAKCRHEYISVTPDGYKFRQRTFDSLAGMLKWFKEHFSEPPPTGAPPQRTPAPRTPQWNGRRRSILYEPEEYYAPPAELHAGGAALARGWEVTALRVRERRVELKSRAGPEQTASVEFEECLLATGAQPRRLSALDKARSSGRVRAVRGAGDAVRLAATLRDARDVVVVGGGARAAELAISLSTRSECKRSGLAVIHINRKFR